MKLEVLVATMNQSDLSLVKRMNLGCDAILANQCGSWQQLRSEEDGNTFRMVCTDTRGVGLNRNLALAMTDADIVLFADDDVTYYDGTLEGVKEAFRQLPDADVIVFGLDMTKNGEVFDKRRCKVKRLQLFNALKYGAARMAVRPAALKKHNIWFSTLFGGGCPYGSGEDSLLLRDCFRAGLRVYSHDYVLGKCAKDSSSWFDGFGEKFMYDKGAWIACAFPRCKHLIKWYFIRKFSKKTTLSPAQVTRWINAGIRGFGNLQYFPQENAAREEIL